MSSIKIKEPLKKNRLFVYLYELIFQRPIFNVFKKNHSKKVLFSYSTYHFNKKKYNAHSNYQESFLIAKIFDEMGYIIDVINNNKRYKINFNEYDVIFGEGLPMFQAIQDNVEAVTIYYATGSHPWQCTEASLLRLIDYYKKNQFLAINSMRMQDYRWGIAASLSDAVIVIGNKNTKHTFSDNGNKNVYMINPTFLKTKNTVKLEKLPIATKSMLFFGSYGLLHKGLDLVVDAFRENPDWILHVCGYTYREKNYLDSLKLPKNIKVHGFIDINSALFSDLSKNCGYVILPSSSEGIATSVLTVMGNGGMIPIVTKECGVDVDDFGILIDSLTVNAVKEAIRKCNNHTIEDLLINSKKAFIKANNDYTVENYYDTAKQHISTILTGVENE